MLRTLVSLLAVTSVAGQAEEAPGGAEVAAPGKVGSTCAIGGTRATDDLLDVMVYVMASVYRCDAQGGDKVRCALDISAAVESVNRMALVIVKTIDQCGEITTEKPACGIAIGELTRAIAGLSAASSGIVAKCPNEINGGKPLPTVGAAMASGAASAGAGQQVWGPSFGMCIINVKNSVKSLFKTIKRILVISDQCAEPGSEECAHNVVKLVDGIVSMAEFISGSVAKCGVKPENRMNGQCAQYSAKLAHAVGEVGVAGTALDGACAATPAERLYLASLDQKKALSAPATSSLTMGLTALLPLTAVVAFVAGKRLAKARSVVEPQPDEEMLVQNE